ncbi:MAG: hypothetical protein ABIP80_03595, partial [Ferruginibacter sp.]
MLFFLVGSFLPAKVAAQCNGIAVNPDQAVNGRATAPISPVDWINGNVNESKSHYVEGQSIPYRIQITGLIAGQHYTHTFCYDITKGGKHAIDYLTSYQRISETVDPTSGLTGYTFTENYAIPTTGGTGPALYYDETAGFQNQLTTAGGTQYFSIYNGDITNAVYSSIGNENSTGDQSTCITISFIASSDKVLLAFGGHIATEANWGDGNGATGISGSPYHLHVGDVSWIEGGCTKTIGNQDLQLQANAVCRIPIAEAGPGGTITCTNPTVTLNGTGSSVSTASTTYTYSWVASNGGHIISAGNTLMPVVDAAGTYTLTVTNTNGGCTATDFTTV